MGIGSNLFDASPGQETDSFLARSTFMNLEKQFLCSHLITIRGKNGQMVANLERIWAKGATVNAEETIEPGTELHLPDLGVTARVVFTEVDDAGHYLDLEFIPPYLWTVDKFRPQHLTDPSLINNPD